MSNAEGVDEYPLDWDEEDASPGYGDSAPSNSPLNYYADVAMKYMEMKEVKPTDLRNSLFEQRLSELTAASTNEKLKMENVAIAATSTDEAYLSLIKECYPKVVTFFKARQCPTVQ